MAKRELDYQRKHAPCRPAGAIQTYYRWFWHPNCLSESNSPSSQELTSQAQPASSGEQFNIKFSLICCKVCYHFYQYPSMKYTSKLLLGIICFKKFYF